MNMNTCYFIPQRQVNASQLITQALMSRLLAGGGIDSVVKPKPVVKVSIRPITQRNILGMLLAAYSGQLLATGQAKYVLDDNVMMLSEKFHKFDLKASAPVKAVAPTPVRATAPVLTPQESFGWLIQRLRPGESLAIRYADYDRRYRNFYSLKTSARALAGYHLGRGRYVTSCCDDTKTVSITRLNHNRN